MRMYYIAMMFRSEDSQFYAIACPMFIALQEPEIQSAIRIPST